MADNASIRIRHLDVVPPKDLLLRPEDFCMENIDIKPIVEARKEHPMYSTT